MMKLQHIFVASVVAIRINSKEFTQDIRDAGAVIIFQRRESVGTTTGPLHVETRLLKLVARDQTEAHSQALRIAREIVPETEGWGAHASHEIEIIRNVQSFRKGFG